MQNKFTIIIPTKNRANTLYWTLKTCLNQSYDEYSIIVCDNNSIDNTYELVESFNDSRIKYYNTNINLGMSENWEFALSKVNDGFISILGDDDGLMPNSLIMANKYINLYQTKAIVGRVDDYYWDDFPIKEFKSQLHYSCLKKTKKINSLSKIDEVLTKTYNLRELPSIYSLGFYSFDLIKEIKSKSNGVFFNSIIPDVYSSMAIALEVKEYYYVNFSFFLMGLSGKSNGASHLNSKTDKSISEKFMSESNKKIYEKLVYCPNISLICFETFFQASRHLKNSLSYSMEQVLENLMIWASKTNDIELYNESIAATQSISNLNNLDANNTNQIIEKNKFKKRYITFLLTMMRDLNFSNLKYKVLVKNKIENIYDATIYNYKLESKKNSILFSNPIGIVFNYLKIKTYFTLFK